MSEPAAEAWVEVNVVPRQDSETELLLSAVEPLIHQHLAGEVESWHFFWEPELRLRLRWRDPARSAELEEMFFAQLDAWQESGLADGWAAGSHGGEGRYTGEAEAYGPEAWDLIQKDWMNGSELALRLIRLDREGLLSGGLTPTLERHWSRHVHLFTNQLFGWKPPVGWLKEVQLCQEQASGYLRLTLDGLAGEAARGR